MKLFAKVVALTTYSLLFAELFVRLLDPQPLMPRYVTGTSWGVRGNIAGARYRHTTPEVDVEYRINSQGMRADRTFGFDKAGGVCRIGLFGDSFFVGYELDLRDSLAYQLETRLAARGLHVEVLNFAVSGFGTAEMLRTYEGHARRFDLDTVIFQFHATDFDDNVRSGLYRVNDGILSRGRDSYLPGVRVQDALMRVPLYALIADNSHLYAAVRQRAALAAKNALVQIRRGAVVEEVAADADAEGGGEQASVDTDYSGRLTGSLLVAARDQAMSDGAGFLLVDIPSVVAENTFRSHLDRVPANDLAAVKAVSPLRRFAAAAGASEKLYFEKGARHLTPRGVQLLADEVAAVVDTDPQVARCRGP